MKRAGCLIGGRQLFIDPADFQPVDQILRQVRCITRANDLDFAQHLADDDLKVFVIDVLTLGAVDLLDLRSADTSGRLHAH